MNTSEPDTVARLREALASLSGKASGSADTGRVFDALHGKLSAEQRRAVVDDLVLNPDAAEAWRLARELPPDPAAVTVPARRQPPLWMSVAAAAVLVAGMAWQFVNPRDEPAYRSGEQQTIASLLPPAAVLARAKPVLRWTALEGARYRVRVLTPELQVLEETGGLASPEHTLGPDALGRIPAGSEILWQVEGRIRGSGVVVSPTFSVRVE
jgi:hypothetical protein